MRVIQLTQGQHTVVDDDVYEWASKFKWHAQKRDVQWYAARNIRLPNGKKRLSYLHREILNAPPGVEVDHKDVNGLNNLGDNIRVCDHVENSRNTRKRGDNTSGFKGVSFSKSMGQWMAQIVLNKCNIYIGCFDSAIEAARAYDNKAAELFGEFAWLNFPEKL